MRGTYLVEAKVAGKWVPMCRRSSIGHKRIQSFAPVKTSALRLTVEKAAGTPEISKFSAFSVPANGRSQGVFPLRNSFSNK